MTYLFYLIVGMVAWIATTVDATPVTPLLKGLNVTEECAAAFKNATTENCFRFGKVWDFNNPVSFDLHFCKWF
jgi:hypothetical protein